MWVFATSNGTKKLSEPLLQIQSDVFEDSTSAATAATAAGAAVAVAAGKSPLHFFIFLTNNKIFGNTISSICTTNAILLAGGA